jgi:hypothetical protein
MKHSHLVSADISSSEIQPVDEGQTKSQKSAMASTNMELGERKAEESNLQKQRSTVDKANMNPKEPQKVCRRD